jgi:hypothetical protein
MLARPWQLRRTVLRIPHGLENGTPAGFDDNRRTRNQRLNVIAPNHKLFNALYPNRHANPYLNIAV